MSQSNLLVLRGLPNQLLRESSEFKVRIKEVRRSNPPTKLHHYASSLSGMMFAMLLENVAVTNTVSRIREAIEWSDRCLVRDNDALVQRGVLLGSQRVNLFGNAEVVVLGVPLGYNYRDVDEELERCGVDFTKLIWRTEDNMEYLEISLKGSADLRNVDNLRRIHGYPVIVLECSHSTRLLNALRDYQIKVDVRGTTDTDQLIEYFKEFGPIVLLLPEDEHMQSFYIVYRDRSSAREMLRASANRSHLDCYHPKTPIEVKRLHKEDTFTYIYCSARRPTYRER